MIMKPKVVAIAWLCATGGSSARAVAAELLPNPPTKITQPRDSIMYLILLTLLFPAQQDKTLSLTDPAKTAKATLGDVRWLVGNWKGKGLGGDCVETWTAPHNGVMQGMFRFDKETKPIFYELCLIVEHQGSLVLKIKHFHPNLASWEDKDKCQEFPLVKLDKDAVYFSGITFRNTGPDSMDCTVKITRQGQPREEDFRYQRLK